MVEHCVDNAAAFAAWVASMPALELMNPAPLNIVCFRLTAAGLTDDALDELNREAVRAIQADGRTFVTGTSWAGRAAIRAAFDNWRTTLADVALLQDAVGDVRKRLLSSG